MTRADIIRMAHDAGIEGTILGDRLEAFAALVESAERTRCATICDELEAIWTALKDAALLNGDIALSNAQAGEPRAARLIKSQILNA